MIHKLSDVQSTNIGPNTKVWQYAIILKEARIGDGCNIQCHTFIENDVEIGDRVTIKPGVYIWNGIKIEDDVMIGPNVTFTNDKWPKSGNKNFTLERTLIKKGASIGAGATILCGLIIGEYALIAAGALVTKEVPPRALMVGVPAVCKGWMNKDGSPMIQVGEYFKDNTGQLWIAKNGILEKV